MKEYPDLRRRIKTGEFDLKYWIENLPFPQYKPVSGGKVYFDGHGDILSCKYRGFVNKFDTWAKLNVETGKLVKSVELSDGLLFLNRDSAYMLEKIGDDLGVVRYNRQEVGF